MKKKILIIGIIVVILLIGTIFSSVSGISLIQENYKKKVHNNILNIGENRTTANSPKSNNDRNLLFTSNIYSEELLVNIDEITDIIQFTYESNIKTKMLQYGWPINLGPYPILASPTSFDFDNDTKEEIVIATYGAWPNPYWSGRIFVIDSNGSIIPGWPFITYGPAPATPAIGDLDNNGVSEIIAVCWNYISVLNFDGSLVWEKYFLNLSSSSPVLADIDQDSYLEIILTVGKNIHVLNHDGTNVIGWPYTLDCEGVYSITSTPAVGDLEGDGDLEIVVNVATEEWSGKTYVFEADGTLSDGWPVDFCAHFGQSLNNPPGLADLNGDGDLEIARDARTEPWGNGLLYLLEHDGTVINGWPQIIGSGGRNGYSFGDIDNDDLPEIVIGRYFNDYPHGRIYVFNYDGTQVDGWPFDIGICCGFWTVATPCVISDVNSDSIQDIIFRAVGKIYILNGDGTNMTGWPQYIEDNDHIGSINPSPLITDLNGDNDVEIIAPSFFGLVYAFDLIGNKLNTEWPMFQYNRYNTGCYPVGHSNNPPKPPIIDGPINGKPGTSYTYTFNSTDPDHNDILEYTIDWGDNTGEEIITGPYASGEEVTGSHTWTSKGTFTIKAKAKDIDGAESTWSEFQVTMPRNKAMVFSFVLRLFERFPNAFPILQFILRLY